MTYSNDTLEYQDGNENIETDQIITENFLQQGIDGDSDIAEEDPVIVDPSEKIEPGTSNEYIEVKDDYKEADLSILQAVTVGTSENIDLESETDDLVASAKETSSSGESSNIDNTSPAPVTSTYLPPDTAETEYQIELQDVQKLSILTKPELVSICKRNNISVTGEKQALAARILRKLGKIFDDNEDEDISAE